MYGAEMWRITAVDMSKLDGFQRISMRKILRVFRPNQISNEECAQVDQYTASVCGMEIRIRRRRCIRHVLRRDISNITRTKMIWVAEGKRRPCRPRRTWRMRAERERKEMG